MCQQRIIEIQLDLAGVLISGKTAVKDRAMLEEKLQEALAKLTEGKFDGALGKLIGFQGKVVGLLSAKKISSPDAQILIDAVEEAIGCIDDLS